MAAHPRTSDLTPFASACAMLRALREGDLSAVELLELHQARLDRYNGALNVIVWRDYD